jgi:hypothetical protein
MGTGSTPRSPARALRANEEGLDVGQERRQVRVGRHDVVPRVEGQQRLRRAGRARVEGGDSSRLEFTKKKATLTGICRLSHCPGESSKSGNAR